MCVCVCVHMRTCRYTLVEERWGIGEKNEGKPEEYFTQILEIGYLLLNSKCFLLDLQEISLPLIHVSSPTCHRFCHWEKDPSGISKLIISVARKMYGSF